MNSQVKALMGKLKENTNLLIGELCAIFLQLFLFLKEDLVVLMIKNFIKGCRIMFGCAKSEGEAC
jgi:hypothetical protein